MLSAPALESPKVGCGTHVWELCLGNRVWVQGGAAGMLSVRDQSRGGRTEDSRLFAAVSPSHKTVTGTHRGPNTS